MPKTRKAKIRKVESREIILPKPKVSDAGYTRNEIKTFMTKEEFKKFGDWMCGQTVMVVKGKHICYSLDVKRFLKMVRLNIPTYFD